MRHPLVLCSFLAAASAAIAAPVTPVTIDLKAKAYRTWDFVLPAEQFAVVGSGFAVPHAGGERYDARLEGERLRADLDGDHETEALVEGDAGFLTFTGRSASGHPLAYSVRLVRNKGEPWKYTSGGAMVGDIRGTRVQVIDQNLNGRFDDFGADALVVGPSNAASFLSKVLSIDGALYSIEIAADGSSLTYAPYGGESGMLDLLSKFECKAQLSAAVVTSQDGRCSFDVAKGALRVPAGDYTIACGQLSLGESRATLRTGRSRSIHVGANVTQTVAWGGPVTAEFASPREGDALTFTPWDIWYYGQLGEEYSDFVPLGKSPEFAVKNHATGEQLATASFPGNCCSAGFKPVAVSVPGKVEVDVTMTAENWAFGSVSGTRRDEAKP